jgi:hypothetical protein
VPIAELPELFVIDGIREFPRRLLGFVLVPHAAQRVNHPLSVQSHGHQAFRYGPPYSSLKRGFEFDPNPARLSLSSAAGVMTGHGLAGLFSRD